MRLTPQIDTAQFRSENGIEVPSVTADQMREVDRIAVRETGPNLFQMMENAGRNVALFAIEALGKGWKDATFLVMAGGGGNGGGAICAASTWQIVLLMCAFAYPTQFI